MLLYPLHALCPRIPLNPLMLLRPLRLVVAARCVLAGRRDVTLGNEEHAIPEKSEEGEGDELV